ncbi:MAG: hypothetical protein ACP5E4_01175 [Candidatus Aenigmatarchaeota archaeon]
MAKGGDPADSGNYHKKEILGRSDAYNNNNPVAGTGNYDTQKVRLDVAHREQGYGAATPAEGYTKEDFGSNVPELNVRKSFAERYFSGIKSKLDSGGKGLGLNYSKKDAERVDNAVESAREADRKSNEVYVRSVKLTRGAKPDLANTSVTSRDNARYLSNLNEDMVGDLRDKAKRDGYAAAASGLGEGRWDKVPSGSVKPGDRMSPDRYSTLKADAVRKEQNRTYESRLKKGIKTTGLSGFLSRLGFGRIPDKYTVETHREELGRRNAAVDDIKSEAGNVKTVPGEPAATITPIIKAAEMEAARYRSDIKPGDVDATEQRYGAGGRLHDGLKKIGGWFGFGDSYGNKGKEGTHFAKSVHMADTREGSNANYVGLTATGTGSSSRNKALRDLFAKRGQTEPSEEAGYTRGEEGTHFAKSVHMMPTHDTHDLGYQGATATGTGSSSRNKALRDLFAKRGQTEPSEEAGYTRGEEGTHFAKSVHMMPTHDTHDLGYQGATATGTGSSSRNAELKRLFGKRGETETKPEKGGYVSGLPAVVGGVGDAQAYAKQVDAEVQSRAAQKKEGYEAGDRPAFSGHVGGTAPPDEAFLDEGYKTGEEEETVAAWKNFGELRNAWSEYMARLKDRAEECKATGALKGEYLLSEDTLASDLQREYGFSKDIVRWNEMLDGLYSVRESQKGSGYQSQSLTDQIRDIEEKLLLAAGLAKQGEEVRSGMGQDRGMEGYKNLTEENFGRVQGAEAARSRTLDNILEGIESAESERDSFYSKHQSITSGAAEEAEYAHTDVLRGKIEQLHTNIDRYEAKIETYGHNPVLEDLKSQDLKLLVELEGRLNRLRTEESRQKGQNARETGAASEPANA